MEEVYEAMLGNKPAGKVQLIRQGLYYRVICRCILPSEDMYRLYALQDTGKENLGVVVPDGEGYILDRRIPVKRLSGMNLQFVLSSGMMTVGVSAKLLPISPEEPFLYIDRLKNAFLESENGKVGIYIAENPESV